MPLSLFRIMHHFHSFTRLEIYHHIYFMSNDIPQFSNCEALLENFKMEEHSTIGSDENISILVEKTCWNFLYKQVKILPAPSVDIILVLLPER